jgi:hypothetical protein
MFTATGEVIQPAELLYKKLILIERGSFAPITNLTFAILESARARFQSDEPPAVLMEMTLRQSQTATRSNFRDFLARADTLAALGHTVMISNYRALPQARAFLRRQTPKRIGFAMGLRNVRELNDQQYYTDMPGGVLQAMGELFRRRQALRSAPCSKNGKPIRPKIFKFRRISGISTRTCGRTNSSKLSRSTRRCSPSIRARSSPKIQSDATHGRTRPPRRAWCDQRAEAVLVAGDEFARRHPTPPATVRPPKCATESPTSSPTPTTSLKSSPASRQDKASARRCRHRAVVIPPSLASQGWEVTLADISRAMLERARVLAGERVASRNPQHTAESMPYPDATFDLVTCRSRRIISVPWKLRPRIRARAPARRLVRGDRRLSRGRPADAEEWIHQVENCATPATSASSRPGNGRASVNSAGLAGSCANCTCSSSLTSTGISTPPTPRPKPRESFELVRTAPDSARKLFRLTEESGKIVCGGNASRCWR